MMLPPAPNDADSVITGAIAAVCHHPAYRGARLRW
jgi:hypothetical protein